MVTQAGHSSSPEESLMYNARVKQTTQTGSLDQFDLRDESRVRQYLHQYPFLLPLIIEAQAHIKRLFSPDAGTALPKNAEPMVRLARRYGMKVVEYPSQSTSPWKNRLRTSIALKASSARRPMSR